MNDDFNWLDYAEPVESAPAASERRGLRRLVPRLRRPRLPGFLRALRLPRLPSLPGFLRLPRLPSMPSLRFLRRRSQSETESTAADLVSVQADRPVNELDERLLALRERSQPATTTQQALYDVDELLVTPEIQHKPGGVISAVALSKAQQQQVEMLKDIVGGPLQADEGAAREGRGLPSLPGFSLGAAPRLIAAAFLMLVVSLPFVSSDFAEGELPPVDFHEGRHGPTNFYNQLDNLSSDDTVLVAFEYGPTAAGELDQLAELFLRHIFAQRAVPLIVSSNPIAVVHAQNIISELNRSVADTGLSLEHGSDYFILRYLPGGAVGLRELSGNFADVVRVSAKGVLTGLEFTSLEEMTLTVLIAETADDMRNWVEQALPRNEGALLLVATGYAAQPLAQAYVDSTVNIIGPVVGLRDAYTYGEKLELNFADFRPAQPPAAAPQAPVPDRPPQPPLDPPQEPVVEPVELNAANESQAELSIPTPIPPPTATPSPIVTPPPTATATTVPTATALPTATAEPVLMVEVISPQQVRVRRGPTTVDDILQLARTGDTFEVVGTNGDGSWYEIALPNGLDGWIAGFLVEERLVTAGDTEEDSASVARERTVLRLDYSPSLGKNERRYSQALPPDPAIDWEYIFLRDRSLEIPRLQAMTLGTLAAALTIVIGNFVAALRAFRQRPQNRQSR